MESFDVTATSREEERNQVLPPFVFLSVPLSPDSSTESKQLPEDERTLLPPTLKWNISVS